MNHVVSRQLSSAGDGRFTDSHRTMFITFLLDRRPATLANRSCDARSENQVVVGRIDDGVHLLLDQISADDHDSRRRHSSTSTTCLSRSSRVARAMPLTPTAEIVIEAHATPPTSASCNPAGSPPVLIQRASIPPANASPAPVVSISGGSATAGTRTTPYSVYAATPLAPCLMTRPL